MEDKYPYIKCDGEILELDDKPVVDCAKLTLEQWLIALNDDTVYTPDWEFPTDNHKTEYIATIHTRSESEFRNLVRLFLIESGSLPMDIDGFKDRLKYRPEIMLEFDRRLIATGRAWEGITWVLDLLPYNKPEIVLEVLRAYSFAHGQLLPDGRFRGFSDAMSLIRARYLSNPQTSEEISEMLLKLNPKDFEALTAKLYRKMGYSVDLTPYSKDDGADLVCYRDDPGRRELLIVQCKRHTKNVGVKDLKELLGTVLDRKATKGVLVTPSGFTKPAINKANENPQIELLGGISLQKLLAENLGSRWTINLDRLIAEGSSGK
jgi:restriction system protein